MTRLLPLPSPAALRLAAVTAFRGPGLPPRSALRLAEVVACAACAVADLCAIVRIRQDANLAQGSSLRVGLRDSVGGTVASLA